MANITAEELKEVNNKLSENGYWLNRQGGDMIAYSRRTNPIFY